MMRSIPLRGFDQQMSNMIVDYMEGKAVDADGNTVMIGQSAQLCVRHQRHLDLGARRRVSVVEVLPGLAGDEDGHASR